MRDSGNRRLEVPLVFRKGACGFEHCHQMPVQGGVYLAEFRLALHQPIVER